MSYKPDNTSKRTRLKHFRTLLKIVLPNNSFYSDKFSKAKIYNYKDIRNWNDFKKIPYTTKHELRQNQAKWPPYGNNLSKQVRDYVYLTFTSGTSNGMRFNTLYTSGDYERAVQQEIIWLKLMDIRPDDKVMYILPFALYQLLTTATIRFGAMVIPADNKSHSDLLNNILKYHPTVIETSPTVILNLMKIAKEKHVRLKKIGVRKIILTGEPGVNEIRSRVERVFGVDSFDALGSTELSIYSFDCKDKKGPHLIESNTIFEVLDPKTGMISDTGSGEMVCTALWRHDFPFIRYRTGDFVKLSSVECSCGWKGKSLVGGILYRIDGTIKINEIDVTPVELERVIQNISKHNEFTIVLNKRNNLDEFKIYIELPFTLKTAWLIALSRTIDNIYGIKPVIRIVPPHTFKVSNWKSARFYDLRNKSVDIGFDVDGTKLKMYSFVFRVLIICRKLFSKLPSFFGQ